MAGTPTDQFAGAEQSVDQQGASALAALAQFGRRGLEEAVAGQKSAEAARAGMEAEATHAATQFRAGESGAAELRAISQPGAAAYTGDAAKNVALMRQENGANEAVTSNYFKQAREAVPLLRTNANSLVDQYRRAYEEKQAAVAAETARQAEAQRQAVIALQAEQERARQEAMLYEVQHQQDIRNGLLTPEDIAYFEAIAAAQRAEFNKGDRPANWRPGVGL